MHWGALDGIIYGASDNTPEIVPKGALPDLCKDARKGAPEVALKAVLQATLEFHLFMYLSMHKCVQNDSIKYEIEGALYVTLEGTSKISF